jgi:hypothetical protein
MLRIRRGEKRTKVPVGLAVVDIPIATTYGIILHEKRTVVLYEEVASPDR